ncbi:MAG: hypothetical protein WBD02_05870, partial [Acidimicrobiia bacterium]
MSARLSPLRRTSQASFRVCTIGFLAVSIVIPTASAFGAVPKAAAPRSSITVVSQDTCVDSGEAFAISLQASNKIRVRVHDRISTREQFNLAIFASFKTRITQKSSLTPDSSGTYRVEWIAGQSPLRLSGIYPVAFSEFDSDGTEIPGPVSFICVNPETPPTAQILVMGRVEVAPLATPQTTDRVDWAAVPFRTLVSHAADANSEGYFFTVGGNTVERWARAEGDAAQSGFQDLKTTAANGDIVPGTYVPLDNSALVKAGLSDAIADNRVLGAEQVQSRLPGSVAPTISISDAPTLAALAAARQESVAIALVPSGSLNNGNGGSGVVRTISGSIHVVTYDDDLSLLWQAPMRKGDEVLRAHQLAAAVAFASRRADRPIKFVVIDGGRSRVSERFLQAWDAANQRIPGVSRGSLAELNSQATASAPLSLIERDPGPVPIPTGEYRQTQADLRTLASTVDPSDPIMLRARIAAATTVASGPLINNAANRARPFDSKAWGAVTQELLGEAFAGVSLPSRTRLTLASAKVDIPLTIRNGTNRAIPILLRLT